MVEGYSLVSMLTVLLTLVTCATDGGVVVEGEGFTWRLPADVAYDNTWENQTVPQDWAGDAGSRSWRAVLPDHSFWILTRWSVTPTPKKVTAKEVLRRWRNHHACVSKPLDGGIPFPGATLQFAHHGSCKGGDLYARRVAVFERDGGIVVMELDAARFISTWEPAEQPRALSAWLDVFVQSLELR